MIIINLSGNIFEDAKLSRYVNCKCKCCIIIIITETRKMWQHLVQSGVCEILYNPLRIAKNTKTNEAWDTVTYV